MHGIFNGPHTHVHKQILNYHMWTIPEKVKRHYVQNKINIWVPEKCPRTLGKDYVYGLGYALKSDPFLWILF